MLPPGLELFADAAARTAHAAENRGAPQTLPPSLGLGPAAPRTMQRQGAGRSAEPADRSSPGPRRVRFARGSGHGGTPGPDAGHSSAELAGSAVIGVAGPSTLAPRFHAPDHGAAQGRRAREPPEQSLRAVRRRTLPSPPREPRAPLQMPTAAQRPARAQPQRETAYWERRHRQYAAKAQLTAALVRWQRAAGVEGELVLADTWGRVAYTCQLRRWLARARHRAEALLRCRLALLPAFRRISRQHFARVRERVARRSEALALIRTRTEALALRNNKPRPIGLDCVYDSAREVFLYRSADGTVSTVHPSGVRPAGSTPAVYDANGSPVTPRQPPAGSTVVLRAEASGGLCYVDTANGDASWDPPPGSGGLQGGTIEPVDVPSRPPPALPEWLGLGSLRSTDWRLIRSDADGQTVHREQDHRRSATGALGQLLRQEQSTSRTSRHRGDAVAAAAPLDGGLGGASRIHRPDGPRSDRPARRPVPGSRPHVRPRSIPGEADR